MTISQIKRIRQAITETEALLDKERAYSGDLQKPEMISFYEAHIVNLNEMIAGSED